MPTPYRFSLPWRAPAAAHSRLLAVLTVGAIYAVFLLAGALWPDGDRQPPGGDALQASKAAAALPPPRLRCETCGVVEAIQRIEAANGAPAAWVFTVRLRDGSLRHSRSPLPGRWQVGDRMQLIGGDRAWSLP